MARVLEFTLNRPGNNIGEDDSYQGSLWGSLACRSLPHSLPRIF